MKNQVLRCQQWDDFLSIFTRQIRKISVPQMERMLPMIPPTEEVETRQTVPDHLTGQDYKDYLIDGQNLAVPMQPSRMGESNFLATSRIDTMDPGKAQLTRKLTMGTLASNILTNPRSNVLDGTVISQQSPNAKTLLNATMQQLLGQVGHQNTNHQSFLSENTPHVPKRNINPKFSSADFKVEQSSINPNFPATYRKEDSMIDRSQSRSYD